MVASVQWEVDGAERVFSINVCKGISNSLIQRGIQQTLVGQLPKERPRPQWRVAAVSTLNSIQHFHLLETHIYAPKWQLLLLAPSGVSTPAPSSGEIATTLYMKNNSVRFVATPILAHLAFALEFVCYSISLALSCSLSLNLLPPYFPQTFL